MNNHQVKPVPVIQSKPDVEKNKNLLEGKPIIFVGGGPGSGKGTQCEKMIAKYGFTHLSAGDLIRAAAQDSSTEKGRYFNDMMSQGKLISTVIKSSTLHDNQSFLFVIGRYSWINERCYL